MEGGICAGRTRYCIYYLPDISLVYTVRRLPAMHALTTISSLSLSHCKLYVCTVGSGKGTNCAKIVESFGYTHLSKKYTSLYVFPFHLRTPCFHRLFFAIVCSVGAGDLLREERSAGGELADMINSFIKEGKIVPAEVTVNLLKKAMEKSSVKKFLIDGFPRDMVQLTVYTVYFIT